MLFTLSQEDQMLKDLVARFVKDELMPLEQKVLARDAAGTGPLTITREENDKLDARAKELGLWGLDAPAEFGGSDLPVTSMIGVNEELGRCALQYRFPPDSPNLHMLMKVCNEEQRQQYLAPYARGDARSAIAISEPSGGGDPASMRTRAATGARRLGHQRAQNLGERRGERGLRDRHGGDRPREARAGRDLRLPGGQGHAGIHHPAQDRHDRRPHDLRAGVRRLLGAGIQAARAGRQRLRPDAIASLDPPRTDRRHLRRPREAGSGHDGRVRYRSAKPSAFRSPNGRPSSGGLRTPRRRFTRRG